MKLNLGCGLDKREGFVNIDIKEGADIICDIQEDGLPFDDNSIDLVLAKDFLEHISREKTIFVIEEIWRVLKYGGEFIHSTPSTDGRGAFQDPTHRSYWNKNSWLYYTMEDARRSIGTVANFEIINLQDQITSDDFKIIHTNGHLKKIGAE